MSEKIKPMGIIGYQEGGGMIGWDRALSKDEIETVYERWTEKVASGKTSLEALREIAEDTDATVSDAP